MDKNLKGKAREEFRKSLPPSLLWGGASLAKLCLLATAPTRQPQLQDSSLHLFPLPCQPGVAMISLANFLLISGLPGYPPTPHFRLFQLHSNYSPITNSLAQTLWFKFNFPGWYQWLFLCPFTFSHKTGKAWAEPESGLCGQQNQKWHFSSLVARQSANIRIKCGVL